MSDTAKATAFLDGIFGIAPGESTAGAPAPDTAQVQVPAPAPAPEPEQPAAVEQPAQVVEQPASEQQEGSLADLIRQQRMDRAARQAKEREAQDVRGQLEQAQAQLARYSKADMVADPIGFAQAHGLTEQEMALVGQAYLYHLVPDKAPPDLRYKMLEAKTARERRQEDERRQAEAQAAVQAETAARIQNYQAVLGSAVQTWETPGAAHPFPESQAWFGSNHDEYTMS